MTKDSLLLKPAARILGIAESGISGAKNSILGGVVMRVDLIIDGIVFGEATVRGMDASDAIIEMLSQMNRDDLNGILLHGTIIAGYNIIDLTRIHELSKLPVLSVTKEPHEDLQTHLKSTFPLDWKSRWEIALQNGSMQSLRLNTQSTVYVQYIGCKWDTVTSILKKLTRFGGVPEPIRVARLLARAKIYSEQ